MRCSKSSYWNSDKEMLNYCISYITGSISLLKLGNLYFSKHKISAIHSHLTMLSWKLQNSEYFLCPFRKHLSPPSKPSTNKQTKQQNPATMKPVRWPVWDPPGFSVQGQASLLESAIISGPHFYLHCRSLLCWVMFP